VSAVASCDDCAAADGAPVVAVLAAAVRAPYGHERARLAGYFGDACRKCVATQCCSLSRGLRAALRYRGRRRSAAAKGAVGGHAARAMIRAAGAGVRTFSAVVPPEAATARIPDAMDRCGVDQRLHRTRKRGAAGDVAERFCRSGFRVRVLGHASPAAMDSRWPSGQSPRVVCTSSGVRTPNRTLTASLDSPPDGRSVSVSRSPVCPVCSA
jgi:hypothetical protein